MRLPERSTKRRKTAEGKAISADGQKKLTTTTKKTSTAPKTKRTARSRVQGRLRNITTMPLDVLLEVLAHPTPLASFCLQHHKILSALQPSGLLALARTSKPLRQVVMNRSHIGIWRAARSNVPGPATPEPPVGISEPAWAQLLYGDSGCYVSHHL